ncbi:MAG: ATP-dependent RecD-like DNA helicase, partial [Proteobacteria bacterium]
NFMDRKVTYMKEDAYDLKLAYSITIHKSQGSEFPVVIIPVTMQHFIMLQRNLIYTALTRARKLAILIGTSSALNQAIRTQTSLQRQTLLVQRLNSGR